MIKKAHLRLTVFCMFITGAILVGLSLVCLQISEKNLRQSSHMIFQNQIYSVISYLEMQDQISTEWLAAMENNKKVLLGVENNGYPLIYTQLNHTDQETELICQAKDLARGIYGFDLSMERPGSLVQHIEFEFSEGSKRYAAAAISIPKRQGFISAVLVYPQEGLRLQIRHQRMLFAGLDLGGLCLLALFSGLFTSKILRPVEEGRIRQNEFIATASHELKTPLMVILSNLNAMEDRQIEPAQYEKFKHAIHTESVKMSQLVNDMLALARTDHQAWEMNMGNVALDTLVINVYEKYEQMAEEKGIFFSFEIPDELMAAYECDVMKIEQAICILMDNAFSYTQPGGWVKISVKSRKHHIRLSVADNGPGVPDEDKERIFERFSRGNQSGGEEKHYGLGLCIAREIARKHRGVLHVEDTVDGGATFVLELPL